MSLQSRIALCLVSLALAPAALAQTSATSTTETTTVSHQVKGGEVLAVYGNKVVLKELDGVNEYTLPDGFKFQLEGRSVGVEEITPGMKVGALITDKVVTRQVRLTEVRSATVMQIAPGGIVVKNQKGELKSIDFKDAAGNDIHFVRDGKEVSLRNVKKGERLSGTFVTTLPPQQISERSAVAGAVRPPPPEPVAVAAAPARKLPKTASPLPLVGLLAALSAGIALTLRAARASR